MELIKLTRQDLRYIVNESVKRAITEARAGKQLNLDTLVAHLSMPYQQLNESVLLEELLRASNIITLSPYRQGNISTVCHNMKEKGAETSYQELRQLAVKIKQHYGETKGLVIVPIPSRSGYSEEGAKFISDMLGARYCPCIGRNPGQSLYMMKKSGREVSEEDTGFYLKSVVPNGNILLFDNVVATGTSLSSAMRLLGRPCDIACLAVDYEKYNV